MPETANQVEFELTDHLRDITHLRRQARTVFEDHRLAEVDMDDLETILGELATNAARHGKGGSYNVRIAIDNGLVVITVSDKGNGFAPDLIAAPGTARHDCFSPDAALRFGGFGLPLVRKLADQMDILPNHPRGTCVRVAKNLQASA